MGHSNMKEFTNTYGFQHITSSPHYPQSNGLAERTVKTMKRLLKHTTDPYLVLLSYHCHGAITVLQRC